MGLSETSWGYTPQIQGHGDGKTHHFWLVVSTYPSEKSWSESQLGWWHSKNMEKSSKPPSRYIYIYNILHTGYIWIPGILDMILDICSDHTDHPIWDASMATCWSFPSMKPVLLTSSLPYVQKHCAKGHISRKSRKVMTFPDFKLCTFVIKMICWMISSSEHNIHVTYRLDECCIFRHHNL